MGWFLYDRDLHHKIVKQDQAITWEKGALFSQEYIKINKGSCRNDEKCLIEDNCQQAEKATSNNDARTMHKILRDLTGKSVGSNVQKI